jgi:hypothetical protein
LHIENRKTGATLASCERRPDLVPPAPSSKGDLTANQISRQGRQPIQLVLSPTVFDGHVLAFDIAGFI